MERARYRVWTLGLATFLSPWLLACGGVNEVVCEGRIEGNRCIIDPAPDTGTGSSDTHQAPADTSQAPQDVWQRPQDTSQPPKDVGQPPEDAPPDPEWVCEPPFEAVKPIGAACSRHCECETGYCYDEAYLGDFRFCTRDCDGGCGKGPDGQANVCLNLNYSVLEGYNLTRTWICQRGCTNLDGCAAYSGVYDSCGVGTETKWKSVTLASQKSCTILSAVK